VEKNELIAILQDWNLWKQELPSGIPRPAYLTQLKRLLKSRQVLVITGPRRAGKSFLMRQLALELVRQGAEKSRTLMMNFEDPRLTEPGVHLLQQIYEAYREFLAPPADPFLFLDEVQEIDGWEKWVRTMHELRKASLIISGSNAKLLGRELGTLLTGRHLDVTVLPLSFGEFLRFNGLTVKDPLDVASKQVEIRGLFRRYLEYGAFPEVALAENKKEILLGYFEDLVHKDLLRRFRIRKPNELKDLVKFYLSNAATLTTFNSMAKQLKISTATVEKFSGYLEQVYLVSFLQRFSFKVREQRKSPRKVYAVDTGLAHAVGFRFSENIGRMAENLVFLALKRRQFFQPDMELYYWKDIHHREVDFVVKKGARVVELIQVCWDLGAAPARKREMQGLAKALREFRQARGSVITGEVEAQEEIQGRKVRVVPLWRWLLQEEG